MTRPTLLLDIDGVLNAIPEYVGPPGYAVYMMGGYVIHLNEEIASMVAELRRHYGVCWFTLWNDRAATLMGPHVGLESVPFIRTSWLGGRQVMREQGYPDSAIELVLYAKTPMLPGHLGPDDHWVWIDDAHGRRDQDYLKRQGFDPANFRLLRTDPRVGLTWDDVQRAVSFVPELGHIATELEQETATRFGPGSTAGRAQEA